MALNCVSEYWTFSSPSYPGYYPNNYDHTTTISVPSGAVVIQFDYFNLEAQSSCSYDVVEVLASISLHHTHF